MITSSTAVGPAKWTTYLWDFWNW